MVTIGYFVETPFFTADRLGPSPLLPLAATLVLIVTLLGHYGWDCVPLWETHKRASLHIAGGNIGVGCDPIGSFTGGTVSHCGRRTKGRLYTLLAATLVLVVTLLGHLRVGLCPIRGDAQKGVSTSVALSNLLTGAAVLPSLISAQRLTQSRRRRSCPL